MELPKSTRTKSQILTRERIKGTERLSVKIRHDDECGNGHNTFAITATWSILARRGWKAVSFGMQHETVAEFFPELVPYLKWHLCSTDGPLHYIANSMYHASDKDCWGRRAGEPASWNYVVVFAESAYEVKVEKAFWDWLQSVDYQDAEILEIPHPKTTDYKFAPRYTFTGFGGQEWHRAPFHNRHEAENFLAALRQGPAQFVQVPATFSEGKTPDLEAARSCAIWPEAQLEDFTEEKLLARLPALLGEFKAAVKSLGLVY